MSVAFDIANAGISARLAGREADRALLDRCLQAMLCEEVLPRVATQLGKTFSDDTILCLLDIDLHCRMSLQEVFSGAGAGLWADRLAAVIVANIEREDQLWRFENRWDFVATYLRWRLGLCDLPTALFDDVGPLGLLSPRQAWTEALRLWPEIWRWLAPEGAPQARSLLRALLSQGGGVAVTEVYTVALNPYTADDPSPLPENLVVILEDLSQFDFTLFVPMLLTEPSSTTETAFLVALCLGPELSHTAPRSGLVLALLIQALRSEGHRTQGTLQLFRAMRLALADCSAEIRRAGQALLSTLGRTCRGRGLLRDLTLTLGAAWPVTRPGTAHRSSTDKSSALPMDVFSGQVAENDDRLRRLSSPLAGLCLLLPYLAENRIARAFPAHARLTALALLAAGGPVEQPEDDPLLRAIAGVDPETLPPLTIPDRPSGTDLLFVSTDRRGIIEAAQPGPVRLALWLEARFAVSLPGLSASSRAFLAAQFLHRSGSLQLSDDQVLLELDPIPLSVVLQLGGCTGPDLCRLDWLQGQTLSIQLREMP